MKYGKKLAALLVSTQILLALTACSSGTSDSSNSTNNNNSSSSNSSSSTSTATGVVETEFDIESIDDEVLAITGMSADTVIATVGDMEITLREALSCTLSELDNMAMYEAYGMMVMPWDEVYEGKSYQETVLEDGVHMAVLYRMIEEKGADLAMSYSDEYRDEVNDYIQVTLKDELAQGNDRLLEFIMWHSLLTEADFLEMYLREELYGRIMEHYFNEETGELYPDEESILASMEEESYYAVQHILIGTPEGDDTLDFATMDEEQKAEALAYATRLYDELASLSGDELAETFSKLMLEHSQDPGSLAQPEGYVAYPGQMVEPFEEASLAMEVGGLSAPVESSFGYHVIYRLPLTVSPDAISTAVNTSISQMQQDWLSEDEIVLTENFALVDLKTAYQNLNVLRGQTTAYIEAGTLELPEVDTSVESDDETEAETETETDDETEEEGSADESAE